MEKKKKEITGTITGDMTLGEVVSKHPDTIEVLFKYGLHCIGCHVASYETIEQGAVAHGLERSQIDKMLDEMNQRVGKKTGK